VKALWRENIDVNAKSGRIGGTTPLMLAMCGNFAAIVELLADAGKQM
jgi:hypothetical protein